MKWLIFYLLITLLTETVLRFEDEHIGGKEVGENSAVQFRFFGNIAAAKDLIGQARAVLGDVKRRMHLGGLIQFQNDIKLESGAIISVHSIRGQDGMPDNDKIAITVPISKREDEYKAMPICLGYIVQIFCDLKNDSDFYRFELKLPSGGILKNYDSNDKRSALISGNDFAGFPDNNAKYDQLYEVVGYDDGANADILEPIPNVQEVFVANRNNITSYVGHGSTGQWTNATDAGDSSTPSGWTPTSSFKTRTTSCGLIIPVTEITQGIYGEDYPLIVSYSTCNGGESYSAGTVSRNGLFYEGGYTIGGGIISLCVREDGSAGGAPASDLVASYGQSEAYRLSEIVVSLANEATQRGYDGMYPACFKDKNTNIYVEYGNGVVFSTIFYPMYRRNDNKGFMTNQGFYFSGNKITFTQRSQGYGEASIFMMPDNSSDKYRYEKSLQDIYNSRSDSSDIGFYDVGSGGVNTMDELFNGVVLIPPPSGVLNVTGVESYQYHINDDFGVPVDVEFGIHTIKGHNDLGSDGMAKIYLLVDYRNETGAAMIPLEYDIKNNTTIKIRVGEFEESIGELVSIS